MCIQEITRLDEKKILRSKDLYKEIQFLERLLEECKSRIVELNKELEELRK